MNVYINTFGGQLNVELLSHNKAVCIQDLVTVLNVCHSYIFSPCLFVQNGLCFEFFKKFNSTDYWPF